jgi:hypothetical protein
MATNLSMQTQLQWPWAGLASHTCIMDANKICQVETTQTTEELCGNMVMTRIATDSNKSKKWAKWGRTQELMNSTNKKHTKVMKSMLTWEETKFWLFWPTEDMGLVLQLELTLNSTQTRVFATYFKMGTVWMLMATDLFRLTLIMVNQNSIQEYEIIYLYLLILSSFKLI